MLKEFIKTMRAIMERNSIVLIAAGVAYFGILALFPALSAVVLIISFFVDTDQIRSQLSLWEDIIPPEVLGLISSEITDLANNTPAIGFATISSIIAGLWFARSGVGAMIKGINAVNGLPKRGAASNFGWTMMITLIMIFLAALSMFAIAALSIAKALLPDSVQNVYGWDALRLILALAGIGGEIAVLYLFSPNTKDGQKLPALPGAIFALFMCMIASYLFTVYVEVMGSYNRVYGSLGAFAAMLVWMFLQAYFILFGAVINAAIAPLRAASLQQNGAKAAEIGVKSTQ